MVNVQIHIPFEPVSWAAPRLGRGHAYDPREKDKRAARYLIREQYTGPLLESICLLWFRFTFQPPKSVSKAKRAAMLAGDIIPTKKDLTNLQKLYEDCLKGIVIKDDRQVQTIFAQKMYGEKDGVYIGVYADYS